MTGSRLQTLIKDKDVAFITVKNRDYIRVSQIERIIKKNARNYRMLTSEKRNPVIRTIDILRKIKKLNGIDADVVILGFLPQLIWKSVQSKAEGDSDTSCMCLKDEPLYIADFFISLFDTIVLDRKYISNRSPVAKALKKLDERVLREAGFIITDTKADADFFSDNFEISRDKFEALYLEADRKIYHTTDFFDNDKERHNFPKTKVLYFGTGLPLQGTDVVMEAFLKLSAGKDFYCTYVGSTKRISKSLLKNAAESDNIRIIDWLNQEELSKEIGKSDVCLAGHFNPDIDKADRTIPGKALIYEAMGKTMILGDTKANHEIFKEDSKHFFVKRGDADALARSVADICEINGQKT